MHSRPRNRVQSTNSGQPTALQGYEADQWIDTVHEGAAVCALQLGPLRMLHQSPGRHSKLQKAVCSHMQLIALPAVRHPCENTCALLLMHEKQAWHQQHRFNCYIRGQDRCVMAATRVN